MISKLKLQSLTNLPVVSPLILFKSFFNLLKNSLIFLLLINTNNYFKSIKLYLNIETSVFILLPIIIFYLLKQNKQKQSY